MRATAFCLLLTACVAVVPLPARADAPPPPPPPDDEQALEPQVTIRHQTDKTLEEYRIGGRLYMIKVIPKRGKPYYLVDSDGNGSLDLRQDELDPRLLVPAWVIFRW